MSFAATELEIIQRGLDGGLNAPRNKLIDVVTAAAKLLDTLRITRGPDEAERIAVGQMVADLVIYCALRDIDLSLCFAAYAQSTKPPKANTNRGVHHE